MSNWNLWMPSALAVYFDHRWRESCLGENISRWSNNGAYGNQSQNWRHHCHNGRITDRLTSTLSMPSWASAHTQQVREGSNCGASYRTSARRPVFLCMECALTLLGASPLGGMNDAAMCLRHWVKPLGRLIATWRNKANSSGQEKLRWKYRITYHISLSHPLREGKMKHRCGR